MWILGFITGSVLTACAYKLYEDYKPKPTRPFTRTIKGKAKEAIKPGTPVVMDEDGCYRPAKENENYRWVAVTSESGPTSYVDMIV